MKVAAKRSKRMKGTNRRREEREREVEGKKAATLSCLYIMYEYKSYETVLFTMLIKTKVLLYICC